MYVTDLNNYYLNGLLHKILKEEKYIFLLGDCNISDDDDDDDDDDHKMHLALFPARTIVRDPHHLESLTHCEQDLNLCRT